MRFMLIYAITDRTMAEITLHDTIRTIVEVSAGVRSQDHLTGHMTFGIDWLK